MISKVLILCLALPVSGLCQAIVVKNEKARIKSEYGEGFEAVLEGTFEEVETALAKWMKAYGKVKTTDKVLTVADPMVGDVKYSAPIFAQARQTGNVVSAWMGVKPDEWSKKDLEEINPAIKDQVYQFAVTFRRDKIQSQIDESVRAAQAVERQQQRLQNQSRDLNTKIEDNKREKLQLEKSIENNKLELILLTERLEKNKHDQDSVAVAAEQIRKVIEMHKERLNNVNR